MIARALPLEALEEDGFGSEGSNSRSESEDDCIRVRLCGRFVEEPIVRISKDELLLLRFLLLEASGAAEGALLCIAFLGEGAGSAFA